MKEHRYILEPYKGMNTRYHCPGCNDREKTFVRYIDTQTGAYLADHVGKCNRENNCGYNYSPKQYFVDNKISFSAPKPQQFTKTTAAVSIKAKSVSFISVDVFKHSLISGNGNHFVTYLHDLFGKAITKRLIETYFIGSSKYWSGATVFWQIDEQGRIRTGKIMLYSPTTGKRVKEPFNHINWVHTALKLPEFELKQCWFGEHLLQDKTKPVALVESEKTAIIASVCFPQYLWLAVGSLTNLSAEKCSVLKGRTVVLFPDLNCYDNWCQKAKQLTHIATFTVSDLLERNATEAEKQQGYDIADYLKKFDYKDFIALEPNTFKPEPAAEQKNQEKDINELTDGQKISPNPKAAGANIEGDKKDDARPYADAQQAADAPEQTASARAAESGETDNTADCAGLVQGDIEPEVKPIIFEIAKEFVTAKITDLAISLKEFQGRKEKFSKQTYDRITKEAKDGTLNRSAIPPIQIWKNPETGKWTILAGHSRVAAFTDINNGVHGEDFKGKFGDIKAQVVESKTLDGAKKIALESNAGAMQTELENAKYVRNTILPQYAGKPFAELREKLKTLYGRNTNRILAFAHLNPNGKSWQSIENFDASQEGDNTDKLKQAAKWIGEERMKHEQLTDAHEDEMYDFLITHSGLADLEQTEFAQRMGSLIDKKDFNTDTPLNLARIKNKNIGERRYDDQYAEIKTRLKAKEDQLVDLKASINNMQILRKANPNNPIYNYDEMLADTKKTDLENEIVILKKEKHAFKFNKRNMINSGLGELTLWDTYQKPKINPINNY